MNLFRFPCLQSKLWAYAFQCHIMLHDCKTWSLLCIWQRIIYEDVWERISLKFMAIPEYNRAHYCEHSNLIYFMLFMPTDDCISASVGRNMQPLVERVVLLLWNWTPDQMFAHSVELDTFNMMAENGESWRKI